MTSPTLESLWTELQEGKDPQLCTHPAVGVPLPRTAGSVFVPPAVQTGHMLMLGLQRGRARGCVSAWSRHWCVSPPSQHTVAPAMCHRTIYTAPETRLERRAVQAGRETPARGTLLQCNNRRLLSTVSVAQAD